MSEWQLIETAPTSEAMSFLVLRKINRKELVVMQVSNFQGHMYPDHLDSAVDYDDIIDDAVYWMPLMPLPLAPIACAHVPARLTEEKA